MMLIKFALLCLCAALVSVAQAQQADKTSPCRAYPELGIDLSLFKQNEDVAVNFTINNQFGPTSVWVNPCGNAQGVLVRGSGGPASLAGPLISLSNNTGAFLTKGYLVYTYRNADMARRHCGPAGVSYQVEFRCDPEEDFQLTSAEHSFCNIIVTMKSPLVCPPVAPYAANPVPPPTDKYLQQSHCRAYEGTGIDLSPLREMSSEVYFKWNTIPGYFFPCGSPLNGTVLDLVSPRHGYTSLVTLDNMVGKQISDKGISFTFRNQASTMCRSQTPTVLVVFECSEEGEEYSVRNHSVWERCFVSIIVSTKHACSPNRPIPEPIDQD